MRFGGGVKGRVFLVGAGPGDAELLTLKAVRVIRSATVLLVDDLVSDEVLAYANANARVVYVGKRGGCASTPQAFIEKLMASQALAGETVVRLKGGDPFIFGRGGEEVEHLRSHGIEVDVVNGITSGLAAVTSMGVPLTHRTHAHGVIFLTGHATPHKDGVDWSQLAKTAHQSRLTLVIYMGFKACAHIQVGLLNGLPKDTPVLIVQNASLPTQRQASSQLDQLVDTINKKELQSPCIIVVGDVLKGLATLSSQPPVACENTHLTAT